MPILIEVTTDLWQITNELYLTRYRFESLFLMMIDTDWTGKQSHDPNHGHN